MAVKPADTLDETKADSGANSAHEPGFAILARFLPYLWPAGAPVLRLRLVVALILVLLGKAVMLVMPFAYKAAMDAMSGAATESTLVIMALVVAYAGARFGGVLFDCGFSRGDGGVHGRPRRWPGASRR